MCGDVICKQYISLSEACKSVCVVMSSANSVPSTSHLGLEVCVCGDVCWKLHVGLDLYCEGGGGSGSGC